MSVSVSSQVQRLLDTLAQRMRVARIVRKKLRIK